MSESESRQDELRYGAIRQRALELKALGEAPRIVSERSLITLGFVVIGMAVVPFVLGSLLPPERRMQVVSLGRNDTLLILVSAVTILGTVAVFLLGIRALLDRLRLLRHARSLAGYYEVPSDRPRVSRPPDRPMRYDGTDAFLLEMMLVRDALMSSGDYRLAADIERYLPRLLWTEFTTFDVAGTRASDSSVTRP